MSHLFLVFASLALLGVITAQDYLWAPLRNETISMGLDGPYHWWLDGSYLVLAIALIIGFRSSSLAEAFAVTTATALILSGVANTAYKWVDRVTGNKHEQLHLAFTVILFLGAAGLEIVSDHHHIALWGMTTENALVPLAIWGLTNRKDYVEKIGVLLLCLWVIFWAI